MSLLTLCCSFILLLFLPIPLSSFKSKTALFCSLLPFAKLFLQNDISALALGLTKVVISLLKYNRTISVQLHLNPYFKPKYIVRNWQKRLALALIDNCIYALCSIAFQSLNYLLKCREGKLELHTIYNITFCSIICLAFNGFHRDLLYVFTLLFSTIV